MITTHRHRLRRQGALFVLALVIGAQPQRADTQTAATAPVPVRVLAERIVAEINADRFGQTRRQWSARYPGVTWREYRGETGRGPGVGEYRWPSDAWCAIADDDRDGLHRQAVFYGLYPALRDCSLSQLTVTVERPIAEIGRRQTELYGELLRALTERFGYGSPGAPEAMVKAEAKRRSYGSAREGFFEWAAGRVTITLFFDAPNVGVVVDHDDHGLAAQVAGVLPNGERAGDDIDLVLRDRLLSRVRQSYPEAVNVILDNSGDIDETAAVGIAARLLTAISASTNDDDRAWQALAAEELILKLSLYRTEKPSERALLRPLAPFKLAFESDAHDDMWVYQRGLSEAVIRRYPQSPWGELALVRKIAGGWNQTMCYDSYRDVAAQGEAWLNRHASSPYRLIVTHAVADAYETWWSLSQAPQWDEFGSYSKERAEDGADRARLRAIEWHERVLSELPPGLPATALERALTHLLAEVDTGERRFQCVIA